MRYVFVLVPAAALAAVLVLGAQDPAPAQPAPDDKKQDPDPKKLPPSQKPPAQVFQPLNKEQEDELTKERERYTVKPVEGEPAMPAFKDAADKGMQTMLGGGFLHKSKDAKGKEVWRAVVPAVIGINSGLIEVFATLGPKEHESVMRITCDIHVLDLSLCFVIRISRAEKERPDYPEKYGEADPTDSGRILVLIQWDTKEGKTVTYRAEDLLIDIKRHKPFPRIGWMYMGKWHETEHPVTKKPQRTLRAALSKLVLTTFRDTTSLVDNALKEEDATDDIYAANMFLLPEPGTEVKVIFRRPTEEELTEIKKVEKEIYSK